MTDDATTGTTLSDEDIRTVMPGSSAVGRAALQDTDGTDATDADGTDGTDGDGTDGTDGDASDGTDADGTDSQDADGTDAATA